MDTEPIITDLFNAATGETFKVSFGPASARQRRSLRRATAARSLAQAAARAQFKELLAWSREPVETREAMSEQLEVQNAKFSEAWDVIDDDFYLSAFRALLDRRALESDKLALIDTPTDGDFWLDQEIEPIEVAVNTFLNASATARRADRVDAGGVDGELSGDVVDAQPDPGEEAEPAASDGDGSDPVPGERSAPVHAGRRR
jgi:hypothetical protein